MKYKRGDTIIEVTLAISIFAMMMVGGLAIMNNGLAKAQGTLQLTMARNNIDSQAEALRFINTAYIAQDPNLSSAAAQAWPNITKKTMTATPLTSCKTDFNDNSFAINTQTMGNVTTIKAASTYPRLVSTAADSNTIKTETNSSVGSEGLWIEAVAGSNNSSNKYYDFHIRACWKAPGSNVDTTIGTIVRLYDPAK